MNYPGANDARNKPKYITKLAVSVVVRTPRHWTDINLRDCLNYRLNPSPNIAKPIVICREHNKCGLNTEFYVELRTLDDRNRLLDLSGTRIESCGDCIWPQIEPWDRSSSHQSDRYRNSNSLKHHQYQEIRDIRDGDGNSRPSKRPRVPSPSPNNATKENNCSAGSPQSSIQTLDCKLFLTRNPPSYNPKSFQDHLNHHLKETKMIGVLEDAGGDRPPIKACYESATTNTFDGWVLETRTAKIADSIMNHLSGKLVLSGTRLYFQRRRNLSRDGRITSPSSLPEDTHGKKHSASSFPQSRFKDDELLVYASLLPSGMSGHKFSSFVNSFMKKANLYDRDVVVNSKFIGKKNQTCVLRCISEDAAQAIVDELNDVTLEGIQLTLRRHNAYHKQGRVAHDKTEKIAPNATVRRVSTDTASITTVVQGVSDSVDTSKHATTTDTTQLKVTNENLTKQVLKLLKENKDLKKEKEKSDVASGRHKERIDLENSGRGIGTQKECTYDEMKTRYETVSSQFEKLKADNAELKKEFVVVKGVNEKLGRQVEKAKKEVIDDYERRLFEIHESWKEQSTQAQEQEEAIKRLKVGLEKEAAEKENVKSQLEKMKTKYQEMTDALTRSTAVIQEEMAVRKAMAVSLVELRKAKKRAEKKLKSYLSLSKGDVKFEDKYDA